MEPDKTPTKQKNDDEVLKELGINPEGKKDSPIATKPKRFGFGKKLKFSKSMSMIFVLLIAVVGIAVVYFTRAGGSGDQYFSFDLQEAAYNGQTYTNAAICKLMLSTCHDVGGKLVFENSAKNVWQSGPVTKKPVKTWFGPWWWESGYYNPFVWWYTKAGNSQIPGVGNAAAGGCGPYDPYCQTDGGWIITGNNNMCFMIEDVTAGGHANITLAASGTLVGQTKPTIFSSIRGTMGKFYKNNYAPICLPYSHYIDANNVQYSAWVNSGKVRIDYVEIQIGAYWYTPYGNPYGPYGFGIPKLGSSAFAASANKAKIVYPLKLRTGQKLDFCSKSKPCKNAADVVKYSAKKQLQDIVTNPAVDIQ